MPQLSALRQSITITTGANPNQTSRRGSRRQSFRTCKTIFNGSNLQPKLPFLFCFISFLAFPVLGELFSNERLERRE